MFIYYKYQVTNECCGEIKEPGNMIILLPGSVCAGNLTFLQDNDNHEHAELREFWTFWCFPKKNMLIFDEKMEESRIGNY